MAYLLPAHSTKQKRNQLIPFTRHRLTIHAASTATVSHSCTCPRRFGHSDIRIESLYRAGSFSDFFTASLKASFKPL